MSACPPALAEHAAALLAGTGLTPDDAARIAADPAAPVPAEAAAAARALRDGWAAASGQQAAP
jgi:hypothetical protein